MRIALFPGSFDPLTCGHTELIDRGLSLFDEVIVGIGINSLKKTMFTAEERVALIQKCYAGNARVKAMTYEGLTTDFARKVNATALLRGLRSAADMEFERPVAEINRELLGGIETVFLLSSGATAHISSTIVRELIRYRAPLTGLVPAAIMADVSGKTV